MKATLAAALTMALVACAGNPTPTTAPNNTPLPTAVIASSNTATPPDETVAPAPSARVIVYFTEAADNASSVRVSEFAQQQGWQFNYASARVAQARLAENVWAVVSVSAELTPEQWQALAPQHPATQFVVFGSPSAGAEISPNLLFFGGPNSREDQTGFIAGLVAGHATETERVAVFSDTTTPTGLKYRYGFLAGVRYACPKCSTDTIDMVGTEATEFASTEGARYAALGADVIFAAAGQAGEAALTAAAQNGAWVIGSQLTPAASADKVLTSVYLDVDQAFLAALTDYSDGQPRSGVEPLSLANGGIVMTPFGPAADAVISPLDRQEIEATIQKLADGSLETGVDPVTGEEK